MLSPSGPILLKKEVEAQIMDGEMERIEGSNSLQTDSLAKDRSSPAAARRFKRGIEKIILMNRFVGAVRRVSLVAPRAREDVEGNETGAERVILRHDRSRGTEEWMLDYALQQVINGLPPARKERVNSLLLAFEGVQNVRDPPPGLCSAYVDMYEAALTGDWDRAEAFIKCQPKALTAEISYTGITALHVAASEGHTKLVRELVERMPLESLTLQTKKGDTALHLAAENGKLEVTKILVRKYPDWTECVGSNGNIPILTAVLGPFAKEAKDLVWFLARQTKDPFVRNNDDNALLEQLTLLGYHDITLFLFKSHSRSPTEKNKDGDTLLDVLTFKPGDFPSGTKLAFWERWIYELALDKTQSSERGDIEAASASSMNSKSSHAWKDQALQCLRRNAWSLIKRLGPSKNLLQLRQRHESALQLLTFVLESIEPGDFLNSDNFFKADFLNKAARAGILEMITKCLEYFPYTVLSMNKEDLSPLHVAVANRQEKVYTFLVRALGRQAERHAKMSVQWPPRHKNSPVDSPTNKYSVLHLAALLAPPRRLKCVSGAALQMQRELQWFQEVEKLVDPFVREELGKNGMTAREMFTDEHKDLVEKAEDWMKKTAESCMVVTALIATVVFAATFTVPGGNNQDKGIPIFLKETRFKAFLVSDVVSLFSSITSLLMFLSILVSRFAEEDFIWKLPAKLISGLAFLFIALATMIIAFVSSLWIVATDTVRWIAVLSAVLAAVPVFTFLVLQLPMFVQMCKSTFGRGIFVHENRAAQKVEKKRV